jgi:hypothetical protein
LRETSNDTKKGAARGLCETCRHVRILETKNGSSFYLCQLWSVDAAFAKYPHIPILDCSGYEVRLP